jgi:hypothetical protein
VRESEKGRKIKPIDAQLEKDGSEAAGQPVNRSQQDGATAFREALKLPGERRHSWLALNAMISIWHALLQSYFKAPAGRLSIVVFPTREVDPEVIFNVMLFNVSPLQR